MSMPMSTDKRIVALAHVIAAELHGEGKTELPALTDKHIDRLSEALGMKPGEAHPVCSVRHHRAMTLPISAAAAALMTLALVLLVPALALASTSAASAAPSLWWAPSLAVAVAGLRAQLAALLELLKSPPDDFERRMDAIGDRIEAGQPVTLEDLRQASRERSASEREAVLEGELEEP